MRESEKRPTLNVHAADKLRQLILDNPDLPLVVLVGDEANTGDYSYMFATSVSAEIGEILDCNQEFNDCICYTDRDDFEDDVGESVYYQHEDEDHPDEWWEEETKRVAAEYDPYWKKCILLTVDN